MAIKHRTSPPPPIQIDNFTVGIQLTKGYVALVDVEDTDLASVTWLFVGADGAGYAARKVGGRKNNKTVYMHQVILSRIIGRELIKGEEVDHINLNKLDDHRCNLRLASHVENRRNRPLQKNNTSGYKGVSLRDGKWYAQIQVAGKNTYSKAFDTPEEAYEAYCKLARQFFGEFARF